MSDQHLAKNIIDIYRKYGRAWTELRGEYLYEQSWLDRFCEKLPSNSKVLDLGCGSGVPIARYLSEKGCAITGVDSSDVMLEMAQQNFPVETYPNHRWILGDMRNVQLNEDIDNNTESAFDGILAWDSFFHLTADDQRQMFAQFQRFSKIGTMLMFTSGTSEGEAIGEMFGEALYHASLSPDEYRELLAQNDFQVLEMVANDADCAGHTVWLAQKKSS
ncbi:Methyltransferase domain-containing protein [Acinetobacter marinus]|uniref:Methyltransferase domain-containing protein n=1 Tax=Acinetobacter marinus TaxID=281375 RepID=A0A1G6IHP6_9GAMM|nr:class I SAM-dependent methyltransferase [Acinetobacter marinus]SDC05998.1 Methyltransferase domain-containing protein [Acinetobacter marinus]